MRISILAFAFTLACGCSRDNLSYDAAGDGWLPDGGAQSAGDAGQPDAAPDADLAPSSPPDLALGPDMACYPHVNMCTPNATEPNANGCQERVCDAACWWGGWRMKAGAACVTGTTQGCNAGAGCPSFGVQHCVACQWGACGCN